MMAFSAKSIRRWTPLQFAVKRVTSTGSTRGAAGRGGTSGTGGAVTYGIAEAAHFVRPPFVESS